MSSTQKTIAIIAAVILVAWYFSKRKAAKKEAPKKPINRADVGNKADYMGAPTWEAPVAPPPPALNYRRKPQTVSIKPQGDARLNCDPRYFVELNGQCVWRYAMPGTTGNPIPPMPI